MKPAEITRDGVPAKDDPQVEQAMGVWDNLTADEQREMYRSLYRGALAWKRTKDIDHLVRLAESVDLMARLESADPTLRDKIREAKTRKHEPADPEAVAEFLAQLEG